MNNMIRSASRRSWMAVTSVACSLAFSFHSSVSAQQVTTQTPMQSNGHSFFEQSNVSWSIRNPGYYLSFNGGGAAPPFGGANPNAGINGGFAVGNARINFGFAQGASLSSSTFAPVLTSTSGYPGSIFVGTVRPFVTGLIPVVGAAGGGNAAPVGPLAQRIATGQLQLNGTKLATRQTEASPSATLPQPADFEKRLATRAGKLPDILPAAAEQSSRSSVVQASGATASPLKADTAEESFNRGVAAEKAGKTGLAKVYYQIAASKEDGLIKLEAEARLAALK